MCSVVVVFSTRLIITKKTIELPEIINAEITVFDLLGKEIITVNIENPNNRKIEFALPEIASGTYFIKVRSGNNVYREKIIVTK